MVKMKAVAQFFDRELGEIRKVGDEFEVVSERATLLESRNLAERTPVEEPKHKSKVTLD